MQTLNNHLTTVTFDPAWQVWVELADRDDARVRQAVVDAVGLAYGSYEGVAFESAPGTQFFRPKAGSHMGDTPGDRRNARARSDLHTRHRHTDTRKSHRSNPICAFL